MRIEAVITVRIQTDISDDNKRPSGEFRELLVEETRLFEKQVMLGATKLMGTTTGGMAITHEIEVERIRQLKKP